MTTNFSFSCELFRLRDTERWRIPRRRPIHERSFLFAPRRFSPFFRVKTKTPHFRNNYLSLGLHKGCLSYRRSLQLSKVKIQHFKKWKLLICLYFCGKFLPSWIRRGTPLNPDPQHCFSHIKGTWQLTEFSEVWPHPPHCHVPLTRRVYTQDFAAPFRQ